MTQNAPGKHYRKGLSLVALTNLFPDDATAERWFVKSRWPAGIACSSATHGTFRSDRRASHSRSDAAIAGTISRPRPEHSCRARRLDFASGRLLSIFSRPDSKGSSPNFPVKSPYGSPGSVKLLVPPTCFWGGTRFEVPRFS